MSCERVTIGRITSIMKSLEDMKLSSIAEGQCDIGYRRYFVDGATRWVKGMIKNSPELYPFTAGDGFGEEDRYLLLPFTSLASLERVMRELREFSVTLGMDVVVFQDRLNSRCCPVLIVRPVTKNGGEWKVVESVGNVKSRIHRTIMMIELGTVCK